MTIANFSDIGERMPFPPLVDNDRQARMQRYRALYDGNLTLVGVPTVAARTDKKRPIIHNWFRRVPTFYAEFMFGAPPIITVRDNRRAQEFVDMAMENIAEVYSRALVDMLRFGAGAPAIDPATGMLVLYQPDNWFAVNDMGMIGGDIIAWVSNMTTSDIRVIGSPGTQGDINTSGAPGAITAAQTATNKGDSRVLNVIRLPIDGVAMRQKFTYIGGSAGSAIGDAVEYPSIGMRRVFPIFHGYAYNQQGVSVFEDIQDSVAEMARRLTGLSEVLNNNQRPHLYGPASAVKTDAGGNIALNTEGQYFPLSPGDSVPGYLQWDSDLAAVECDIKEARDWIFNSTGISPLLFASGDSHQRIDMNSGKALRRLMLPMFARLSHYKRILEDSMKSAIIALAANAAMRGGEVITIDRMAIDVEWGYEEIFDDMEEPAADAAPVDGDGSDSP